MSKNAGAARVASRAQKVVADACCRLSAKLIRRRLLVAINARRLGVPTAHNARRLGVPTAHEEGTLLRPRQAQGPAVVRVGADLPRDVGIE